MEKQRNKVCGADIHKKFLAATIISRDGIKITKRFGMTLEDLLEFKSWVVENQCEQVAVESTTRGLFSTAEVPALVAHVGHG